MNSFWSNALGTCAGLFGAVILVEVYEWVKRKWKQPKALRGLGGVRLS